VLLERAVATDPNYAPAWALLAEAIYFDGPAAVQDSKRRKQAAQTVQHALSLAPNFAPALAISALIDGEASKEAEAPLRRAVALDPSYSEAWNWLGNSLVSQERSSEAISAYEHAVAADPFFYPAVSNLAAAAIGAGDQATIDRLLARLTTARADPDMIVNVKAQQAYARGDVSESLRLVEQRGLDGGHPNPLLWDGWFSGLTALGYYDLLHKVTGCPDWYAPLLAGKTLPPMRLNGAPVNPEDFWSSVYFSAPAARAMVRFGRSNDLVKVYRAGFRSVDDFVVTTDRRGILPEVAPDLALALEESGSPDEASYVLTATSLRLEQSLKRLPQGSPTAQLAIIRAAQGDRVRALALLDLALRRGWFPDGRAVAIDLAEEPALRALRGDRRFEAMRRRILDHVARERAELGPLKV
jgi:Tfp pilus assembly protein PilF